MSGQSDADYRMGIMQKGGRSGRAGSEANVNKVDVRGAVTQSALLDVLIAAFHTRGQFA